VRRHLLRQSTPEIDIQCVRQRLPHHAPPGCMLQSRTHGLGTSTRGLQPAHPAVY